LRGVPRAPTFDRRFHRYASSWSSHPRSAPMPELIIACWSYPTTSSVSCKRTVEARLVDLMLNVEACSKEVASLGTDAESGDAFNAIFLAPEYLFSAVASSRRPLSTKHKELLYQKLLAISGAYKKILLVPGTIFFKEDVVEEEDRRRALANLVMAELAAKRMLSQRDYSDVVTGWTIQNQDVPALKEVAKSLVAEGSTTSRARNVAYLLLDGQRQAMYDKQVDFIETRGASPDKLAFIPGTHDQCPEIGRFKVGTEICFDHQNGILSKRKLPDIAFHLLVSASVEAGRDRMAMAKGGYFAHASSDPAGTCVYARSATGTISRVHRYKGRHKHAGLSFWKVPIASPTV
jgi:hypothetical protein